MFLLASLALCTVADLPRIYASAFTDFLRNHEKTIALVEQEDMTIYNFVAPAIERYGHSVGFVVTSSADIPSQFCHSTPCIVAFAGKKLLEIEAPPNETIAFTEWVARVIDPSIYKVTTEQKLHELLDGSEPLLFAVDVDERIDSDVVVYHVSSDLMERCGVPHEKGFFVYRPQDVQFIAYNGSFVEQSKSKLIHISKWNESDQPFIAGFVSETVDMNLLLELADEFHGRCNFMWTTAEKLRQYPGFKRLEGNHFVVFDSRDNLRKKWIVSDVEKFRSIEFLRRFLENVFSDAISPTVLSEPVPTESDSAFMQIVGSNFADFVYDDAKEAVVLFVNDDCATNIKCKMLQMLMKGAAMIMKKSTRVRFYWINVDKNDLPVSLPEINAYPSIMMWPAGRKAEPPEVFHGNSSISDFVEFVSKAASHSFQETSLDLQKVKDKVTEKVNELAAMFAKKRNE